MVETLKNKLSTCQACQPNGSAEVQCDFFFWVEFWKINVLRVKFSGGLLWGRASGDEPKGTNANLRFSAGSCGFLRFPAKISGFLRKSAFAKCFVF